MTGNISIDVSLSNIWQSWWHFRRGKRETAELIAFQYHLEENLCTLALDLQRGTYRHGSYRQFIVTDNKRRKICVANIRDRVVHRLLYEYLVPIYDKTFIHDIWSCRKNKGLIGAIERTQLLLRRSVMGFFWRTDITKFFNHVNRDVLMRILRRKIVDPKALWLLQEVVDSFDIGIPIGNLTSQIFANIYLHELDRFVKHVRKPKAYLRYGDDFLFVDDSVSTLQDHRAAIKRFLASELRLEINPKHDMIRPVRHGLRFLGVHIFPFGRRLNRRNWRRALTRVNSDNIASYSGLVKSHSHTKTINHFSWHLLRQREQKLSRFYA